MPDKGKFTGGDRRDGVRFRIINCGDAQDHVNHDSTHIVPSQLGLSSVYPVRTSTPSSSAASQMTGIQRIALAVPSKGRKKASPILVSFKCYSHLSLKIYRTRSLDKFTRLIGSAPSITILTYAPSEI